MKAAEFINGNLKSMNVSCTSGEIVFIPQIFYYKKLFYSNKIILVMKKNGDWRRPGKCRASKSRSYQYLELDKEISLDTSENQKANIQLLLSNIFILSS